MGRLFHNHLILSFYSEDLVDYLPVLLHELAETGDSDSIESYAENLLGYFGDEGFSDGLFDSINCRESVPYIIIEEPQHTGIVWSSVSASEAASLRSHYCEQIWFAGPPIPPKTPKGIVHPILILSGDIDPITPGRISSHLAEKYSSVQHIIVPGIHGVFGSICADYLARQFFENPRSEVVIHWDCYRENVWD